MRPVTGTRGRIVPRVQMAPGINHPRRARAARAGADPRSPPRRAAGACVSGVPRAHPAPGDGESSPRPGGKQPRASLRGRKPKRRASGGGFGPSCLQGRCCTSAAERRSCCRRRERGERARRRGRGASCPPAAAAPSHRRRSTPAAF